jgi:hypothetical protein
LDLSFDKLSISVGIVGHQELVNSGSDLSGEAVVGEVESGGAAVVNFFGGWGWGDNLCIEGIGTVEVVVIFSNVELVAKIFENC